MVVSQCESVVCLCYTIGGTGVNLEEWCLTLRRAGPAFGTGIFTAHAKVAETVLAFCSSALAFLASRRISGIGDFIPLCMALWLPSHVFVSKLDIPSG